MIAEHVMKAMAQQTKIKLPDVTLAELNEIVYALKLSFDKKIRRAQKVERRTPQMEEELRICQTVLQEMLARAHDAKETSVAVG